MLRAALVCSVEHCRPSSRDSGASCRSILYSGTKTNQAGLDESTRALLIASNDCISAQVRKGLDRQRRVETAHRGESGTADNEEVRYIPALTITVYDGSPGVAAHARTALVVGARHS